MNKKGWKITAIIFMALFFTFMILGIYGVIEGNKEIRKTNICFYDICGGHDDAEYLDDVCVCYDYDLMGYLQVVKTKYMD
jgi:hypothetical protein